VPVGVHEAGVDADGAADRAAGAARQPEERAEPAGAPAGHLRAAEVAGADVQAREADDVDGDDVAAGRGVEDVGEGGAAELVDAPDVDLVVADDADGGGRVGAGEDDAPDGERV